MLQDACVVIVGAGPVGLATALGLAQRGVHVTVLEAGPAIADSPRAMTYHWSLMDGLERLGLLRDVCETGYTKQDYSYLVFRTKERISWTIEELAEHTAHPFNVHIGQNRFAEVVLQHLARYEHAAVLWNHKVEALSQDAAGAIVRGTAGERPFELRGRWVIGADGARSTVRETMGVPFEGFTWPERFVATNMRYPWHDHGFLQANMMIDPEVGAIVSKIDKTEPHGLWRVTYCESADLPLDTVAERIPDYLRKVLPDGGAYTLEQFSPYRMHQRSASTYRKGRILLAGDCAHATNPTGGFGLTCGLFDAFVLSEALAAVIQGEASNAVLDHYAEVRRRIFLDHASPAATEAKRLIYHSTDPVRLERDLEGIRRLERDKDYRMERLLFPLKLRTDTLLR